VCRVATQRSDDGLPEASRNCSRVTTSTDDGKRPHIVLVFIGITRERRCRLPNLVSGPDDVHARCSCTKSAGTRHSTRYTKKDDGSMRPTVSRSAGSGP
jgi:hypothetical protein